MLPTKSMDITVPAGGLAIVVDDRSGADVQFTFQLGSNAPFTQRFSNFSGRLKIQPETLAAGTYKCAVTAVAFFVNDPSATMNRTVNTVLSINGTDVVEINGAIPPGDPVDIGSAAFSVTAN
jgi:hypothetical protein